MLWHEEAEAIAYVENLGGYAEDFGDELIFNVDPLSQGEILGLVEYIHNCKEGGITKPGPCPKSSTSSSMTKGGAKPAKAPKVPAAPKPLKGGGGTPSPKTPSTPMTGAAPAPPAAKAPPAPKPPPVAKAPAPTPPPSAPSGGGGSGGATPAKGGSSTPQSKSSEKFTGEKKDARGYRICYSEGKKIACAKAPKGGADKGAAAAPTPSAPAAKTAEAEAPRPPASRGKSVDEHLADSKASAGKAAAAMKAGDHDTALKHADAAIASAKSASQTPDATDAHKSTADKTAAAGEAFKGKVNAAKAEKDATDKAEKDGEIKHTPIGLKTDEEVEKWGKDNTSIRGGPRTGGEQNALNSYISSGYLAMNRDARGQEEASSFVKKSMQNLDSLLDRSTIDKEVVSSRGVNNKDLLDSLLKQGVGGTFTDKGYMSTSIKKGVADDIAAGTSAVSTEGISKADSAVMHVRVPAGSKGTVISDVGEGELLLARGSKMKIDGHEVIDGVHHFHVSVLSQGN